MAERKKEPPENPRERVRRMRERLKEKGLIQVSLYVPKEDKKTIYDYAENLRIKAGKLIPSDEEKELK